MGKLTRSCHSVSSSSGTAATETTAETVEDGGAAVIETAAREADAAEAGEEDE